MKPWTDSPWWAALFLIGVIALCIPQFTRWNNDAEVDSLLEEGQQAFAHREDPQQAQRALEFFNRAYALSPGRGEVRTEWLNAYFFLARWQSQPDKILYQSLDLANENTIYFGRTVLSLVESFIIFARDTSSDERADFVLTWAEGILRNRERLGIHLNERHHYLWGRLWLLRDRPEEAATSFKLALKRSRQSLKNRFWLAWTYRVLGQKQRATELFQQILDMEIYYEALVEADQYKRAAEKCLQEESQCGAL